MGEVWRARHQAEGVRVAVKLLTAKGASEEMFVESFKNEVRAVAPLEHPHIAMVLDYGSVPEQAAKASKGRLVAGTPFLSMELLEGTTLADHMGTLEWPEIERLLLCLLDALAHAHARSVIHRDLKLSNVLYDADSGRVKLTDFGIAHAMAATDDPFRWGTPAYMPPEQLLGRWWDYGPWTDLYSLGCCAYTLVTGHRAFPDEIKGNLKDRILPPVRPRMAVPRGIESWLETLTAPRPEARFQLAADAAYALVRLREADRAANRLNVVSKKPVKPRTETTIALALSQLEGTDLAEDTLISYLPSDTRVPPMPSRWRPPRDAERSTMLLGAGLGLYGLRRIPMVGRQEERTQLWRELSAVRASGKARLVLLHGPAGSGKTRLGEWLCERANEVGAALVMRATHGPDSATSGLVDMVGRYLRTGGLSEKQILDRVQSAWAGGRPAPEPTDVEQMAALLAGTGDAEATALADPSSLVRRFVRNQARHRPLLVFLDDVQWGADALHVAHQLLSAQAVEPAPVLVVMCAREEALPDQPTERALIDELVDEYGTRIRVDRLSPSEHHDLIQELIGLEGALARRVEERTAGNPLFAVQLIGDWVERGILRPGRRGFQLRDTAEVVVPDDLYAVWRERIDDLLSMRPDSDRLALEIAALLGQVVLPQEWLGACRARGLTPSHGLLDTLLGRRLASAEEGGAWSFAHSMLRESLDRSAVEAGRAAGHHRACATMLQATGQAVGDRLARHLVRAGAYEAALEPTVRAIQAACRAGDFNRADALRALWEEAMEGLELHEGDPRWVAGLVASADVHRFKDRPKQVRHICHRLEHGAERHGWPRSLRSLVRLHQGRIARLNGNFQEAATLFHDGIRLLAEASMASSLHVALGGALVQLGAFEGAEAEFRKAQRHAERLRNRIDSGDAWLGLAEIAVARGELDQARATTARARDAFRQAGHRWGLAEATERFGDIARYRRSWDEALHHYRAAAGVWHNLGTESAALTSDVRVALVEVERGNAASVASSLDQLSARARGFGNRAVWATIRLAQAAADASVGRSKEWDQHLAEATKAINETAYVSPDVAAMAELAGREAMARGWTERATVALELSIQQWKRLFREDDADRVRWALP